MLKNLRYQKYYRVALWVVTLVILLISLVQFTSLNKDLGGRKDDDFTEYWAAGKLNLSGQNPYEPELMYKTQLSAGYKNTEPLLMWNPPWMLALAMPMSLIFYPLSRSIWVLASLTVVLLSSGILWKLYGGDPKYRWISYLIGITFMPALFHLYLGQSGFLVLAGVVGFLYFIERDQDLLAGIALSLMASKPHVGYLLFIAILLWSILRKRWLLLAGLVVALLIAMLVAYLANPGVINQYIHAINTNPPEKWIPQTLGSFLREAIGHKFFSILFLPSIVGLIWLIYYWYLKRSNWDWIAVTPMIVLVSLATTPYGWISDHIVALVGIIQVGVLAFAIRKETLPLLLIIASYIFINVAPLIFSFMYHWSAVAILIFYISSTKLIHWAKTNSLVDPDLLITS